MNNCELKNKVARIIIQLNALMAIDDHAILDTGYINGALVSMEAGMDYLCEE